MAVQKSKGTRRRRGNRRSHIRAQEAMITTEQETGLLQRRHHMVEVL